MFFEDNWKLSHNIQISYGLRYFFQTAPTMVDAATPRLGILWSPSKKGSWTVHAHVGMFGGNFDRRSESELLREDGVARVTSTVYNPVYKNPFAGATPVHSVRQAALNGGDGLWAAENFGGTRALPKGFNLSYDFFLGRFWNQQRSENINSPLNGQLNGPRPGAANLNVLQVQNSGQGHASVVFAGIEQHTLKHLQFFLGGVRVIVADDADNNAFFTPQSSTSDAGEMARRSGQPAWNVFGNGTLTLPAKLSLSTDFSGSGDSHYNITTGSDENHDGNFNDRPQYAAPGTPGAVQTQWGLLVASGGTGVFGRNKGVMPWTFHVDMNLQRTFKVTRNAKADHQQSLTLNLRSANVINHLNVTAVGGVFNSPLFGVAYSADNGRRVEAGARYSF